LGSKREDMETLKKKGREGREEGLVVHLRDTDMNHELSLPSRSPYWWEDTLAIYTAGDRALVVDCLPTLVNTVALSDKQK
jgi:hypothetical protein